MKKEKRKYTLRIYRIEITEWNNQIDPIGEYDTYAVSAEKAFSQICYRMNLRNHGGDGYEILYRYELVGQEETKPEPEEEEDVRIPMPWDDDYKPLRKVENGVELILADNGEYVEVFD